MILVFPNFDTLQLAIVSATVPEEIMRSPAQSGNKADLIYIQSDCKLSRTAAAELKKLGVKAARKSPVKLDNKVTCWHQLVALQRDASSELIAERTPVLFVTHQEQQLVELASEMMRLGNDRQSYRYMTGNNGSDSTALLRVIGPPYYSLLRAIDPAISVQSPNGKSSSKKKAKATSNGDQPHDHPVAFVERSSHVWVQFGFQHPLLDQIRAPVGQSVLIKSNGDWDFIDEAPYQDIYKTLETRLPENPRELLDQPLSEPFKITLQLANAGAGESAELWVIHEDAIAQVESLIASSDDQLLSRLSFAVAQSGDQTRVILRVRPSKLAPPVLVFNAVAFRSYLKLPNLFLPVGKRIHPPLRRDAVAKLLAEDSNLITWLLPEQSNSTDESEVGNASGQSFQTERIEDTAFQPLSNWIEYIMDRESQSLQAWSNSFQFEFDSFVCNEDEPKKPKPKRERPKKVKQNQVVKEATEKISKGKKQEEFSAPVKKTKDLAQVDLTEAKIQPSDTQVKLEQLETEFFDLDEPVDGPARRELWTQMAPLNAGLGRRHDSTICWSNAIWDQPQPDDYQQWLASEMHCSSSVEAIEAEQLLPIINDLSTRPSEGTLIASYLAFAAQQAEPPAFVTEHMSELAQFLQRQEQYMPVRTAWLAWHCLYQLSEGDVLSLARARDRMLERLFQNGLTPEFDMPSFLRVKRGKNEDRYRGLGQSISQLGEHVENWIVEPSVVSGTALTKEYVKLHFAFGLARLGESLASNELVNEACEALNEQDDPIHSWLSAAFVERINSALNVESQQGNFSQTLLDQAEEMERMDRYKVDRFRQQSRILEPLERVDPFVRWHQRYADALAKRLAELADITDRDQLKNEIHGLLGEYDSKTKQHNRVLTAALQIAPRTSEEFANPLVDAVLQTLKKSKDPLEKALLMQKAMFVAAHYGRVDAVHILVAEFEQSLPEIVQNYLQIQVLHNPTNKETVDTIELLFTESFQGLRKLGMREEIGRIYGNVAALVGDRNKSGTKKRSGKGAKGEIDATRPWRLLLCVAGGWFYFGQNDDANKVADSVRDILFHSKLEPVEQKNLMCAYAKAVAMAPPENANARITELFQLKPNGKPAVANVKDNMTTSTHFSISQLAVVETTVLALVNDEHSLNSETRRWLDEDEFLVRSRIHRDVKMATQ